METRSPGRGSALAPVPCRRPSPAASVRLLLALILIAGTAQLTAVRAGDVPAGELPAMVGPSQGGIYEATLDNGLRVLMKEVRTAPIVCVSIWYRVGTAHESSGTTGLAHLLEHMMYKGTERYGKGVYDEILEANGGLNNASTWNDRTNYFAVIAKEKVDLAMELEADRMRGALFTQADLEDEMSVVRNEMEKGEDDPYTELDERIGSVAILEHPYHWPTIGWKSDVESITARQIHDYYDRFYWPNNASLILVGDLPPSRMLEKAAHHFGAIPRGGVEPRIVTVEPEQKGERRFLIRETGNTRLLGIAYRTPERMHPDTPALDLLGRVLSDGKASRLHRALVESGLAVWTSAYNQPFADPFLFFVYTMMTEEADPDAVEAAIQGEIERLKSEPPTVQELGRAKKRAEVEILFSRDDITDLMFSIGEAECAGGFALHDRYLDDLLSVSPEDVRRVTGTYMNREARTVGFYLPKGAEGGSWVPEGGGRAVGGAEPDHALPDRPAGRSEMTAEGSSGGLGTAPFVVDRRVLPNGTVFLARESHDNPTVALRARVSGGLRTEPEDRSGLATLLADVLPLGAAGLGSAEFAERLESIGVDLRLWATPDAIELQARCLSGDFDEMVARIADVVLDPLLDEVSIAGARERLESRLQEELDDTYAVAYQRALAELYGDGSPYARRTLGTADGLAAITREDVVAYHRTLLQGARWSVAVVGDVPADHAAQLWQDRFSAMPTGELLAPIPQDRIVAPRPDRESDRRPPVIRVPMVDRSQVDLVFVAPGIEPGAPDRDAAYLANVVLGGSFRSRLNRALRDDEGLTYGVDSEFEDLDGSTHWIASLGVNPENVEAALAGVRRELLRIERDGIPEAELARAREYTAGSYPIRLGTKDRVAAELLRAERLGYGPDYLTSFGPRMREQTVESVASALHRFPSPEDLIIVMAGTFAE